MVKSAGRSLSLKRHYTRPSLPRPIQPYDVILGDRLDCMGVKATKKTLPTGGRVDNPVISRRPYRVGKHAC